MVLSSIIYQCQRQQIAGKQASFGFRTYKSIDLQAIQLKFIHSNSLQQPMLGQEVVQKGEALCTSNPSHGPKKPSYICLDPTCKNKRLLCYLCLGDQKHLGHKIALINPNVEPFSRLCSNCHLPNAKERHSNLSKKVSLLSKAMYQVQSQITSVFERIRSKLLNPITTLCDTFSREMANLAVYTLERECSNQQEIQKIAAKIIYLLGINDTTFNASINKIQTIEKQALNVINEASHKIEAVLEDLEKEMNFMETPYQSKEAPLEFESTIKLKNTQKSTENPKFKLLERQNRRNILETSKREEQMVEEDKQQLNKPTLRDHKKQSKLDPSSTEKKKPERKLELRSKKKKYMQSEGILIKHEQNQDPQYAVSRSIGYGDQSHQISHESSQSEQEQSQLIEVTISTNQPIGQLQPATYKKIRVLNIQNLTTEPKDLFELLPKLKTLREIHIFDSIVCQQSKIMELMATLPKTIKHIYFNCSNEFNRNCITTLFKRRMLRITRIEYFYNIQRLLRRVDESLYFRDKEKGIRVEPLDYPDTHYMTSCFPNLKNVWIRIKNYRHNRRKNNIKFWLIQSLTIGELQEEEVEQKTELPNLPLKVLQHLKETEQLRCLVLLSLHIEAEVFVKVIKNNKHLETLYLQQCIGPNQSAMQEITKEAKIKNFSFKQCSEITGAFIEKVQEAEIFILDHVWTSNAEKLSTHPVSPFRSFEKCNSLVYFNIYGNPFFNDSLFATLKNSFGTMRSMNIGFTCITEACVQHFKYLSQIQCLCLDENIISAQGIYDICSYLPKLEKLSLCGFNGEKNKGQLSSQLLNQIGKILPNLKHLSLRNCCRIGQEFDLKEFPNLKTVELDKRLGEHFISTLRCGGIKFYDDNDVSEM